MQHLSIRFLIGLATDLDSFAKHDPSGALAESVYADRARRALNILARHYPALTATRGTGYWQGAPEPSLSVEAVVPYGPGEGGYQSRSRTVGRAKSIAREVARALSQESVALVVAPVSFNLEGPDAVQQ